MEWHDEGLVLGAKRHGESSVILDLLTRDHGRHAGLLRGGASKRLRAVIQPGNKVSANWRARLSEHLGSYTVEPMETNIAAIMADAGALEALNSACGLAMTVLPEREPHPAIFDAMQVFLSSLSDSDVWPVVLIRWELGLLQELGFRLDLSTCAVSGTHEDLSHVSPRTGRAVCRAEAAPYKDRLLELPDFLKESNGGEVSELDLFNGFRLTGHFLERWVLSPHGHKLPDARSRLLDRLSL
jgi:DNA repair protein RecO (recombination protein O)